MDYSYSWAILNYAAMKMHVQPLTTSNISKIVRNSHLPSLIPMSRVCKSDGTSLARLGRKTLDLELAKCSLK
jgi:hypothetical protein